MEKIKERIALLKEDLEYFDTKFEKLNKLGDK